MPSGRRTRSLFCRSRLRRSTTPSGAAMCRRQSRTTWTSGVRGVLRTCQISPDVGNVAAPRVSRVAIATRCSNDDGCAGERSTPLPSDRSRFDRRSPSTCVSVSPRRRSCCRVVHPCPVARTPASACSSSVMVFPFVRRWGSTDESTERVRQTVVPVPLCCGCGTTTAPTRRPLWRSSRTSAAETALVVFRQQIRPAQSDTCDDLRVDGRRGISNASVHSQMLAGGGSRLSGDSRGRAYCAAHDGRRGAAG